MPTTTLRLPTGRGKPAARRGGRGSRDRTLIGGLILLLAAAVGIGGWVWWNGSVGSVTVRPHCTATANGVSTELDPEQAGNAAMIAGIAQRRGLPARAATIGIATAIQESKLRNIAYGDRDSVGLFQQRPSQGWGSRAQLQDPVYAVNAFFDVLSKVDGFVNLPITDVAQKVQRSAFPDAYADHEPEARVIASALSGYSPAGFSCELRMPGELAGQQPGSDGTTARAAALVSAGRAEKAAGTPAVSGEGRVLEYRTEGTRQAWALAAWAIGRADGLQVTDVRVADRRWDRSESTQGWQRHDRTSAGRVRITVA